MTWLLLHLGVWAVVVGLASRIVWGAIKLLAPVVAIVLAVGWAIRRLIRRFRRRSGVVA